MSITSTGCQRDGASALSAALRVLCALAALLLILSSAAAETAGTWAERMEKAREKYNEETVHLYVRGKGRARRGKFNVCFYRTKKTGTVIYIQDSLKITDEAEIEAVLEQVVKHEYYSEEEHGTLSFLKAQWIAHNLAYEMATGNEEQKKWAESILGMSSRQIIRHAKELDLNPVSLLPEVQRAAYELIEMLYCTGGK